MALVSTLTDRLSQHRLVMAASGAMPPPWFTDAIDALPCAVSGPAGLSGVTA